MNPIKQCCLQKRSAIICMLLLFSVLISCNNNREVVRYNKTGTEPMPILPANKDEFKITDTWKNYWYNGTAEITTYQLQQSRYGAIRSGNLTNIFVTEDFSRMKQVKLDDPSGKGSDKIPVLKLNQAVKFVTGIYPYSLMLSVFSPVDINNYPHPIKITATAQEWCGNSFYQFNNRNNRFLIEQRSYFENESDQDLSLEPMILEDECWNLIRIDPTRLPQGDHMILPGALFIRLSHKDISPVKATLGLVVNDSTSTYTVTFPTLNRRLHITFEKEFPYRILKWDDSFPGTDGKILTTTATLLKTIQVDYWKKNQLADTSIRTALGLPATTQ